MNPLPRIQVRARFFHASGEKFFVQGVTYGPLQSVAEGGPFASPEQTGEDFRLMREMGANLLRVYDLPPRWLLDRAAENGLRVLISIPWAQHVAFLDQPATRAGILRLVAAAVAENAGHPAIFGWLVGNEIPSGMVRWLGARRVVKFIESLIEIARARDPAALFSYSNYPPTEYLLPQNADFLCCNVYLERQPDFEKYAARLQNLAGDRPLLFGEFGLDTLRHGQEEQARVLDWHLRAVIRSGAAGTIFFAWTDQWFAGGAAIEDWAFGLVTRQREPKKAWHLLREKLAGEEPLPSRFLLEKHPRISVILCSYNGAQTLKACLESLDLLHYPDFEIILVDDGSTDDTQSLVSAFERARQRSAPAGCALPALLNVVQPNLGLSQARNAGARVATGEILAFTDADCMVDPDWLLYLAGTLLSGDFAGVGGPNISPPAVDWVQAAVAAAPGGPTHVLLTDTVAEHIPGCNMAFHKWAFDSVGGFNAAYRRAGDDVDFCWRLQGHGGVIAFSPAAIVWHHRRFNFAAFCRQQEGYGEAESMLRFQHLTFFGLTGSPKWKGRIYGPPRFPWLWQNPLIYHGVFGQGLFQSIYSAAGSEYAAVVGSLEWVVAAIVLLGLTLRLPLLRMVPELMLGATVLAAVSYLLHTRIEPRFDTWRTRWLVVVLALVQPLVRGWARYFTWLKSKRTPQAVIDRAETNAPKNAASQRGAPLVFWSEDGQGREALIAEVCGRLEQENWKYSTDTGWNDWDLQVYGNFWWLVQFRSVTEYHGGPKCLTRARLRCRPTIATSLLGALLLLLLLSRQVAGADAFWLVLLILLVAAYLVARAFRLQHRVYALVEAAAGRAGLLQTGEALQPAKNEHDLTP